MLDGYFSKRYKLRPQSYGLIYEHVPESARTGLCQIMDNYFQNGTLNASQLYYNVSHALHITQENTYGEISNFPRDTRETIVKLIMECEWWQFYDICEVIPRSLNPYFNNNMVRADFHEKVNILFKTEKLGFEIKDDSLVEKIDTSFADANIKNTRYLVKDPDFKEAVELFEKAFQEVYYKTQPDCNKCINDTLSATEAVARIVNNCDEKLASFNEIIDDLTERGTIPRQIDRVICNIYLSLGDHQRITCGMNGSTNIGVDEAELVLSVTAAIITYLVSKSHHLGSAPDLNDNHLFTDYQPMAQS